MNASDPPRGPEESSAHQLKPIRMPWIHLLDPITFELPKNFEQILAKEKAKGKGQDEEKFELKRLPRSAFLDPDAGKPISFENEASAVKKSNGKPKISNRASHLFPNRKLTSANQLKSQKSFGVNKLPRPSTSSIGNGSTKQRKKSSDFQVSKSNSGTSSTITGQKTPHKTLSGGVRKQLFLDVSKPRNIRLPVPRRAEPVVKNHGCAINIVAVTPATNDDTVALLQMSVAESLITNEHESTSEPLELLTRDVDVDSPKNECSSGSSLCEFVQLEQECRTPKQKKSLAQFACYCDRCDDYIERFSIITEKLSELLEESKDILEHLKNCKAMKKNGSNKKRRSSINKENVPSTTTSILTSTKKKKKDLRVDTLKKNVTFNVRNERDSNALNLYNSVRNNILGTPKVLNNANGNSSPQNIGLSMRVQSQCLLLQQTPK